MTVRFMFCRLIFRYWSWCSWRSATPSMFFGFGDRRNVCETRRKDNLTFNPSHGIRQLYGCYSHHKNYIGKYTGKYEILPFLTQILPFLWAWIFLIQLGESDSWPLMHFCFGIGGGPRVGSSLIPLKGDSRNMASHASRLNMRLYCILFCPELARRALERLLSINVALNKQDRLPRYMEM